MDLGIKGKVALVTGASSGLGFAVANALANEGVNVAICSRDAGRINAAAERINSNVSRTAATAFVADLTDRESRESLTAKVVERLGAIGICVINSGGPPSGPFESHPTERWEAAVDEHLGAALALVRGSLEAMRKARWGRIVTITSCSVKQPAAGLILSNTARAAVLGFVRSLANEVAADGITVNNLMPGYTRTNRIDELTKQMSARSGTSEAEIVAKWEEQIPMGRLGTAEEFGAVAAFLCSAHTSYMTGTSISVDGGWNRSLL
ncbi:MAG TPA: SDR family oxidoreductase [Steroidobacteraceae bacterium]|jgi:3-oxoacyl-[acyl-carrier protein] reductase